MSTRYFALVLGIIYLLIGIMGLIPGLIQDAPTDAPGLTVDALSGNLLGIFPVNLVHTIVHLAVGVWGIIAYRNWSSARTFARGVAILFAVLAILGLIPGLNTLFGLVPLHGNDIWLHAITALAAAYFGWMAPVEREERAY